MGVRTGFVGKVVGSIPPKKAKKEKEKRKAK
jgi:hypothetical protein